MAMVSSGSGSGSGSGGSYQYHSDESVDKIAVAVSQAPGITSDIPSEF